MCVCHTRTRFTSVRFPRLPVRNTYVTRTRTVTNRPTLGASTPSTEGVNGLESSSNLPRSYPVTFCGVFFQVLLAVVFLRFYRVCQCVFRAEDGLCRLHRAEDSLLSPFRQELSENRAKFGRRRASSHESWSGQVPLTL